MCCCCCQLLYKYIHIYFLFPFRVNLQNSNNFDENRQTPIKNNLWPWYCAFDFVLFVIFIFFCKVGVLATFWVFGFYFHWRSFKILTVAKLISLSRIRRAYIRIHIHTGTHMYIYCLTEIIIQYSDCSFYWK